jgi:hypothetical protein
MCYAAKGKAKSTLSVPGRSPDREMDGTHPSERKSFFEGHLPAHCISRFVVAILAVFIFPGQTVDSEEPASLE